MTGGGFTVGGTVQPGNLYVSRAADDQLLRLCRAGTYAYILSSRQVGKSSLMVRTAQRLTSERIESAIVDLTSIGVLADESEWYLGILESIAYQLDLDVEPHIWWSEHTYLGAAQRFYQYMVQQLLQQKTSPIVIFLDEIDTTLGRTYSDDFFAVLRSLYNARATTPSVLRLTFVLIGVATPSDLIQDPRRTPFNIGQRLELTDFSYEEALVLAGALRLSDAQARSVLSRVLHWTAGHPYLTQRLCREIAVTEQDAWTDRDVDDVVQRILLGDKADQDSNLQFVRSMLTTLAPNPVEVLNTYSDIRAGRVVADEELSVVKNHLKLSGIVRSQDGQLVVRNRIYHAVFDRRWVVDQLPRHQRPGASSPRPAMTMGPVGGRPASGRSGVRTSWMAFDGGTATVNVFLGGAGVHVAVAMRNAATFYGYPLGALRALDTDPHLDDESRWVLGQNLLLAEDDLPARVRQLARDYAAIPWSAMWDDRQPFGRRSLGFTVTRLSAQAIVDRPAYDERPPIPRSAGWLVAEAIGQSDSGYVQRLARTVMQTVAEARGQRPAIQVVASIAGLTSSSMLLPLLAELERDLGHDANRVAIHLSILLPSTFASLWDSTPGGQARKTRAQRNTYAAMRELEYLTSYRPDPFVRPERRTIHESLSAPRAIAGIWWFGPHQDDGLSGQDETLYQAGRFQTLMTDERVWSRVFAVMGDTPHQVLPSVYTIEYPKYELAQAMVARATVALFDRMLSDGELQRRSVPDVRPQEQGPLLTFIQERRQSPMLLRTTESARTERLPFDVVAGPSGLLAACEITPRTGIAPRGHNLRVPAYEAGTRDEWLAYCGQLFALLDVLQQKRLAQSRAVLSSQVSRALAGAVEAVGSAIAEATEPQSGVPILKAARRRIVDSVADFDAARIFFSRQLAECLDPPYGIEDIPLSSEQQRQNVERLRAAMVADLRPLPPRGWQFSWIVSALFLLIGLVSSIEILLSAFAAGLGLPASVTVLARIVGPTYLSVLSVAGIALFGLHRWWVMRNWTWLPEVRREAESALVQAWEWLVTLRQAEMLWASGSELCRRLVGDPDDRGPDGEPPADTPVGGSLVLIDQLTESLTRLRDVEQQRFADAMHYAQRVSPSVVQQILPYGAVDQAAVRQTWPAVRISPVIAGLGDTARLAELRIEPPEGTAYGLSAVGRHQRSGPGQARSDGESEQSDQHRVFLPALEEAVRIRVLSEHLIPEDLDEAVRTSPQYASDQTLATALEELLYIAARRGAAGRPRPEPAGAFRMLVVPDVRVQARVNGAIDYARSTPARFPLLTSHLQLGECVESRYVGESIALVQFQRFSWPRQTGPHLQDLEDARLAHFAAQARTRMDGQRNLPDTDTSAELFLVPEISAAVEIERRAGLRRPLPDILQQRLYGSHPAADMPSIIELFYLADLRGLLHGVSVDVGASDAALWEPPSPRGSPGGQLPGVAWFLLAKPVHQNEEQDAVSLRGVPLVRHFAIGSHPHDPLGAARQRMILFDAFLAALSLREPIAGPESAPQFILDHTIVPIANWNEPAVSDRLLAIRAELVASWQHVKDARGDETFERMLELVHRDARQMPAELGPDWVTICQTLFLRNR